MELVREISSLDNKIIVREPQSSSLEIAVFIAVGTSHCFVVVVVSVVLAFTDRGLFVTNLLMLFFVNFRVRTSKDSDRFL